MSVLDFLHLGSSLSLRSFTRRLERAHVRVRTGTLAVACARSCARLLAPSPGGRVHFFLLDLLQFIIRLARETVGRSPVRSQFAFPNMYTFRRGASRKFLLIEGFESAGPRFASFGFH